MDKGYTVKGRTVIEEVKPEYLDFERYDNVYRYDRKSEDPFAPAEVRYFRITQSYEDMGF